MPELSVSDAELAVVKQALTAFIHVQLGRPDAVFSGLTYRGVRYDGRALSVAETHEAGRLLLAAAEVLTGSRNGGPGLFADAVSPSARLAFRVIARIDRDTLRESMVLPDGSRAP